MINVPVAVWSIVIFWYLAGAVGVFRAFAVDEDVFDVAFVSVLWPVGLPVAAWITWLDRHS